MFKELQFINSLVRCLFFKILLLKKKEEDSTDGTLLHKITFDVAKQSQTAEVSEKLRFLLNTLWVSLKVWKLCPRSVLCHLLSEIRRFLMEVFCFPFSELRLRQPLKNLVETGLPHPSLSLSLPLSLPLSGSASMSKSLICREIHPPPPQVASKLLSLEIRKKQPM